MPSGDLTGIVLDGRYRVIEPIAEGAMGIVYRAERVKLGRIVAVKILHDVLPSELSSRKRFEIEAHAMAKLEHPHCAAVLDVGVHEDKPYVVMDFVSGSNLKEVLVDGPLPANRAVEIVRQVLSGLAHAHEHGIIHRDVKPANIVLSQKAGLGDHVKILDFGLARLSAEASNLTTGIVVGTPSYMAPEQIRGQALDSRADLYACGVLLFELLTGTKPFISEKDDPIEVCSMHLKVPPPKLADRQPGLELAELEAAVAKALAKSADARYQTAEEFAAALDIVPRRRSATPLAGVPVVAAATASGWNPPVARPPTADGPGFDLSVAAPQAPVMPIMEVSAPVVTEPRVTAAFAGAPPAGPAPNVTAPAPSKASPAARFTRRQLTTGAAAGAVVLVLAIAIVAGVAGGAKPAAAPVDAGVVALLPPRRNPVDEQVTRAQKLVDDGHPEAALELLVSARRVFPDDARLAFEAGRLYFAKFWFTAGLKQFRDTLKLDPGFRTDPELIKTALRGFITSQDFPSDIAQFLRVDIGPPAKSFLDETARTHPYANVRERAATELRRYP
ncbi:MAG: protein kinase [Kofleriaceae bacterium]